jgi:hypothetical protein
MDARPTCNSRKSRSIVFATERHHDGTAPAAVSAAVEWLKSLIIIMVLLLLKNHHYQDAGTVSVVVVAVVAAVNLDGGH